MPNEAGTIQQMTETLSVVSMRLPTPSAIAVRLTEMARDPHAKLEELVELVRCDPALTSKLLRLANSPLYARHESVKTVFEALQMLGLDTAITLTLSFTLHDELQTKNSGGFDITRYWKRSLLTAVAAHELAIGRNEKLPETFFLAGLLRDIGLLAMALAFGERWNVLYKDHKNQSELRERETQALGFDHVEAGAWLLREWHLPDYLEASLIGSSQALPQYEPNDDVERMAAVTAVASHMAQAWLDGKNVSRLRSGVPWIPLHSIKYNGVMRRIMARIPWIERCFEVSLLSDSQRQMAAAHAQEIAMNRTLLLANENSNMARRTQELERRAKELNAKSLRDSMTGLFRREYFNEMLNHAFGRANREQGLLSVAFIDIDHFKRINDTYGHAVGDTVITDIAHQLASDVRQSDVVARYGGEEFVILMQDQSATASIQAMRRLVQNVRTCEFSTPGDDALKITVSVGIVVYTPAESVFSEARELLEAADQAMYVAKRDGRDQIVVYDHAEHQPQ